MEKVDDKEYLDRQLRTAILQMEMFVEAAEMQRRRINTLRLKLEDLKKGASHVVNG